LTFPQPHGIYHKVFVTDPFSANEVSRMKRKLLVSLTIVFLFFISTMNAVADDSFYVQPFRAKIYAKPSIASETLCSVDSGFQFVSTGKEGNWVKLSYNGKQGFIPASQIAKTPPLGKSSSQAAVPAPKLGVRARTSSSSAVVAGMKGLTYEDRARANKGERSDFEALDKVDSIRLPQDELRLFQQEGGKR
jgi:hypothetical protein